MSEQELREYYNGISDCWKLFRKYAGIEGPTDADYWSNLLEDAEGIYNRNDKKLIRSFLLEVLKELEAREKSAVAGRF